MKYDTILQTTTDQCIKAVMKSKIIRRLNYFHLIEKYGHILVQALPEF